MNDYLVINKKIQIRKNPIDCILFRNFYAKKNQLRFRFYYVSTFRRIILAAHCRISFSEKPRANCEKGATLDHQ